MTQAETIKYLVNYVNENLKEELERGLILALTAHVESSYYKGPAL